MHYPLGSWKESVVDPPPLNVDSDLWGRLGSNVVLLQAARYAFPRHWVERASLTTLGRSGQC